MNPHHHWQQCERCAIIGRQPQHDKQASNRHRRRGIGGTEPEATPNAKPKHKPPEQWPHRLNHQVSPGVIQDQDPPYTDVKDSESRQAIRHCVPNPSGGDGVSCGAVPRERYRRGHSNHTEHREEDEEVAHDVVLIETRVAAGAEGGRGGRERECR